MKRSFIVGAAEWNFIDFSSASRQEATPRINNKGLLYNDRRPKDVYYYFQAFLRKDIPVLHIAVDDWRHRTVVSDGEAVIHPIKVYSNLQRLTLSVNGKMLSEQSVDNCHALWQVPLVEGRNQITVSGMYNGREQMEVAEVFVKMQPRHTACLASRYFELAVNVGSNCFLQMIKAVSAGYPTKLIRLAVGGM